MTGKLTEIILSEAAHHSLFLLGVSRRYQQKIFGKGDSDETTAGLQKRLHLEKQHVMLCAASYAERDITVLDSKTSSVTPD